jgi:hypothetical protein
MRVCTKCEIEKQNKKFRSRPSRSKYGHGSVVRIFRSWCKQCESDYSTEKHFSNPEKSKMAKRIWRKLNPEKSREKGWRQKRIKNLNGSWFRWNDYVELLKFQHGKCAVCDSDGPEFHVDHDHKTGVVRGILCRSCNVTLGHVKDSIDRLEGLVAYLNKKYYLKEVAS